MKDFLLLRPLQTYAADDAKSWLGRIVQYSDKPVAAYTPARSRIVPFEHHEDGGFSDLSGILRRIRSKKAQTSFLDLFGFSHEKGKGAQQEFYTSSVRRLRLHNDEDVLRQVLADPEVEAKLEQWDFGFMQPVYMVVGLLIADDISYRERQATHVGGELQLDPAKAAGAAAGLIVPISASIGVGRSNADAQALATSATGKRVFAIEYRTFQKRLRVGTTATRLQGYGPQGDRSFMLPPTQAPSGGESFRQMADRAHEQIAEQRPEYKLIDDSFVEALEDDEADMTFSMD